MIEQVEVFVSKPGSQSSIPETHMVGEENLPLQVIVNMGLHFPTSSSKLLQVDVLTKRRRYIVIVSLKGEQERVIGIV